MAEEQNMMSLEMNLMATSEPLVVAEYYVPVLKSLTAISSALDTLMEEKDESVIEVIEEHVTQSLQTISFWTECADESIRSGNLIKWKHSMAFREENDKVLKEIETIVQKIEINQSEPLDILRRAILAEKQKICLFKDITLEDFKKNMVRIEIDGTISESVLPHLCTFPWEYEDRANNIPELDQFQTMESNILSFYSTNESGIPENCTVEQNTGEPITFFLASKAVDHVADTVLQAKVLWNGKWQTYETQCQGDYIKFQSANVDAFFILGSPREREFSVDSSGGQYIHRTDKRVRLEFQKGSVTETQNYKVTVLPVKIDEMVKRKRMFPDQYKFLSVTKGIHVTGHALKKAVKVELPLEVIDSTEKDEQETDIEYVFFHIDGENVTQLKNHLIERRGNTISTYVGSFSSISGAGIRKGNMNITSILEVSISLGFIYPCKLMTFVKKISAQYVQVWCELVRKEDWNRLEQKRLQEHPNLRKLSDSESRDIFISERQRLRIDVKGNSFIGRNVPKNSVFITFFPVTEDNHIFPPLQKSEGRHGTPFTTITYSMDTGKREIVHTVTFDPWTLAIVRRQDVISHGGVSVPSQNVSPTESRNAPVSDNQTPITGSSKRMVELSTGTNNTSSVKKKQDTPAQPPVSYDTPETEVSFISRNPEIPKADLPSGKNDSESEESYHAQAAVTYKTKEFYSRNFKHFLKDFEIEFVKEACIENGIDAVETFLMLEKDDLRYVIGMNLGQAFYCIKAQKKFLELER
ncbi:uncharacterized protein LOC111101438 [Crassostrea virginica]